MTSTKYAKNSIQEKNSGRAIIKDADISTKISVEIANNIRGKTVDRAIKILDDVIAQKAPIAYKRYNRNIGHRPGMGPGRYPIKASTTILQLVKDAKANAQNKGLSNELVISHMVANKASRPHHYGRQRGTKMKRTHVEIILTEKAAKAKKEEKKKQPKKGDNQ